MAHGFTADADARLQRDEALGQETERPALLAVWRRGAGEGDEVGFLLPVEFAAASGWTLALEGGVEAIEHEGLAHALDGGKADLEGLTDGVVRPGRAGGCAISFEQDARMGLGACWRGASGDERFQVRAFFLG